MSDTTETTTEVADEEARIPRSRLNAEAEKRKAAEKRAADLEERLAALEDAGKSDTERLARHAEKLQNDLKAREQRIAEIEAQMTRKERESWATAAATKLKFRDPGDAARFLDLDEIDDQASAERALKNVVKDRDYLVQPAKPDPRGLERVLANGEPGEGRRSSGLVTPDEAARLHGDEVYRQIMAARGTPVEQ